MNKRSGRIASALLLILSIVLIGLGTYWTIQAAVGFNIALIIGLVLLPLSLLGLYLMRKKRDENVSNSY